MSSQATTNHPAQHCRARFARFAAPLPHNKQRWQPENAATIPEYSPHTDKKIRHQRLKPDVPARGTNNVLQRVTLLLVRSLPKTKELLESVAKPYSLEKSKMDFLSDTMYYYLAGSGIRQQKVFTVIGTIRVIGIQCSGRDPFRGVIAVWTE